ncbi:MAG TPA: hypothetical protein VM510_13290, partial [Caulifigura sp.]|nr:hypothetical protein [Caulifigura sp.]
MTGAAVGSLPRILRCVHSQDRRELKSSRRVRQDFADIFAFGHGEIVAIQTTNGSHLAAREETMLCSEKAHLGVQAGGIIILVWLVQE